MSQQSKRSAYCPNCTKNVPHLRSSGGPVVAFLDRWMGQLLHLLRIGPWHCFHCQTKMWILPYVRQDAENYRMIDPLDMPVAESATIWSPAVSHVSPAKTVDAETSDVESSDAPDEIDPKQVILDVIIEDSTFGQAFENSASTSAILMLQQETDLERSSLQSEDDGLESSEEIESLKRIDLMAKRNEKKSSAKKSKLPEAESVGNFIKDRSLILRSTRMHRVSVKYRDSVVDRILTGKVSISQLAASSDYTEGELVSWIADKVKRLNAKIELLEQSAEYDWDAANRAANAKGSSERS